jgi:hypothetical protein
MAGAFRVTAGTVLIGEVGDVKIQRANVAGRTKTFFP